jgi:hypothetical protein
MRPSRLIACFLALAALGALLPAQSEARQFVLPTGQVAHTRRGPVVLHRMVPPQLGKHVYVGRRR